MAVHAELPRTELPPVDDLAWGTHLCMFFETTEDVLEAVTPYFRAGLEDGEYCIWVVSGRLTKQRAITALRHAMPDLDRYLAKGSLEIIPAREWYLRQGGRLDQRRVIRSWHQRLRQAEARGYTGLRVSGTAASLQTRTEWKDFLEYEASLNGAMRDRRISVLCAYALATSGAADILEVARRHHGALVRRNGAWEAITSRDVTGLADRYAALTPREHQVLQLASAGLRNSEIAFRLSISARTVEVHRAHLRRKLGVRNHTELVRYTLERDLSLQERARR
jgi:DNA-binding CsgD family transcriptional regulator